MKALTIWQPWASLIMHGAKRYEFRGWRCPAWIIGKRIVIYAGARPTKAAEISQLLRAMEIEERTGKTITALAREIAAPLLERLQRGEVELPLAHGLGTAVIGTPVLGGDLAPAPAGLGGGDSDRAEHFNWGWPLSDIQHFSPPLAARGAQGFWTWQTS